jgi:hypothetical protein
MARVPSRVVSVVYGRGVIAADLPQSLMVRLPSIDARGHQRRLASDFRASWYVTVIGSISCSDDKAANSNIIALLATLLVRVIVGPLVDREYCFPMVLNTLSYDFLRFRSPESHVRPPGHRCNPVRFGRNG